MLPPDEYVRAAREANFHIQMVMKDVSLAKGEACLSGTVVNVFRGPPSLEGRSINLNVDCFSPGEKEDWPPDGIGRFPANELRPGRLLEAYVNEIESGLEIVLGLSTVIDSKTPTPQLKVEPEPQTGNRKKSIYILASIAFLVFMLSTLFVALR